MVAVLPYLGVFAALAGVFYQFVLQPKLHNGLGIGRKVTLRNQDRCEKLPSFEACEDGWYHQPSGLLYLACSSLQGRRKWLPSMDHLDASNRPEDDYLAIFDTKATGSVASRTTIVKPDGFAGTNGLGSYNLHGVGVHMLDDETIRLFLINHRPQPGADVHGANSTVELFETKLGSDSMKHLHTFIHPVLFTPNNLAPTGPDSFVFSNDHNVKVGWKKKLDFFFAKSTVGSCSKNDCKVVFDNFQFPNGMAGGTQFPNPNPNVIYIASSSSNKITVAESQADGSLVKLDEIAVDYPFDNLSVDGDGDLWAAGFPRALELLDYFTDPAHKTAPAVLVKVSKNKGPDAFFGKKHVVENMVEDDGSTLAGFTFVEHDTERNIIFAGGVFTPYLAICQL